MTYPYTQSTPDSSPGNQNSFMDDDSTAAMVDAIFEELPATSSSQDRLSSIEADIIAVIEEPVANLSPQRKWQMASAMNSIKSLSLICQGRLLEHLQLDYKGDRKRFLEDANAYGLEKGAIDDRCRVYRILNKILQNQQLTWNDAGAYVGSIPYSIWREITRQKWLAHWQWRDNCVYLVEPAKGAGQELSYFVGRKDGKADALIREALRPNEDAIKSHSPKSPTLSEKSQSNGLTQPTVSDNAKVLTWELESNDKAPHEVRGVNVAQVVDDDSFNFEMTNSTLSVWFEFTPQGSMITERRLHFYDPHEEEWVVFNLPDMGEELKLEW